MTVIPLRPYRPSTGTEGADFFEGWCTHCAKDAPMNSGKDFDACQPHEVCGIIAQSFCEQPAEWQLDKDGHAICTAYEQYREGADRRETWQRTLDELGGRA